jgi:hypothetical protein
MLLTLGIRRRFSAPLMALAVAASLTVAMPAAASTQETASRGAIVEVEHSLQFDDTLCQISVTGTIQYVAVITATGPVVGVQRITYTAANGKSVIISSSQAQLLRYEDNGDGTTTITFEALGTIERIAVPHRGVVLADVGRLVITNIVDSDTGELVADPQYTVDGPHPNFDSGYEAACQAITPALS